MNTLKNISKYFPQKTITPIIGTPSYETIRIIHTELNSNACTVRTNLGSGDHGHLGLTLKPDEYHKQTGTNFTSPSDPGVTPLFPINYTATKLQTIQIKHDALLTIFYFEMKLTNF